MSNRVGQQLGNYRLIRLLGRGGFAEVYLGEHLYLKNHAALKVLRTSLADEEVDRFLSEAQTLARLSHPQIVRVLDFAVEHGTPFLVMDYAPRGTLRTIHPHGSCLSLDTMVAYVKQMATALQYAHNHQVIHRDVKPENMLLSVQQQVMLSDFGLALFTPSPEQLSTQEMAGTIPYMAPEQIRGKPDFASDQYALGIVAYEWLCGVRPFEGAPWQIAYQQVSVLPPRLREHDPSLPEAVETVVLKALAKDPRERYVSVQLFAQALERASHESRNELHADIQVTTPLVVLPTHAVPSKRVFLSSSQDDEAFVAHLATDLQRRGVAVWHEEPKGTTNTSDQEDTVRQAIRAVDIVLLVISHHTRSSRTIREHLRIASMYQRRLVFVWAAGEDIATVLPDEWGKTVVVDLIDARQARYEQVIDELVACLEEELPAVESSLPEPGFETRNPYKGLRAFKQDDAADFFGRDSLLEELTDKVKGMLGLGQPGMPTARMLTVIGPSGSGKSSAVMAGLLPRLQRGALQASQEWVYLQPMVPGTHPLEALALTLAARFPNKSVKALREDLEDDAARGLHLLTTQLVKAPEQRIVLFIDQFEELFTQIIDEAERQRFIDVLVTAVTEPHGSVIVILTLRADFYDRPMSYPELHRLVAAHQVSVLPMEIHNLRAAIKQPAALPDVQLTFEGNLVGDLLFELQGQIGALPLLQFTLDQLFQRRADHTLTLAAYHEIGGVKGALAKQAESTYIALPSEEHRKLARSLFLRLIDPGMTEQDTTRRRAALAEISLPDAKQTTIIREVADAFVAARLLTTNEIAGTTTVEVSHEALIREWSRLADWLREGREDIHLQQAVSEDSVEWEQRGKPRDRLYRGSQLKDAQAWARRNTPSGMEVTFLRASAAQHMRRVISVFAIVLLLVAATGTATWFRTLVPPDPTLVTNLLDDGPGSLRWDIANAPSGSTITFATGMRGTIKLTSGDLNIHRDLSIHGPGPVISSTNGKINVNGSIVVSISDLSLMNHFGGEMIDNFATLTLTNIRLSGSVSSGGIYNKGILKLINSTISGLGDAIANDGTLALTNSTVSGNFATTDGGGIINLGGKLALTNSTVSGNFATTDGGGIYNNVGGTATLINSTVSGNGAGCGNGGAIFNSGDLTLMNSTVSDNIASTKGVVGLETKTGSLALIERGNTDQKKTGDTPSSGGCSRPPGGCGGGIFSGFGQVILMNTTISGNTATDGGGIYNDVFEAYRDNPHAKGIRLTNSTISDNTATRMGGGIAVAYGEVDIAFCTIYGNTAALSGGGISIEDNTDSFGRKVPGQVQLSKSIIAGDYAQTNPDISGALSTYGYNLIQDDSGITFTDPLNKHSTDLSGGQFPDLRIDTLLRNNGGPTKTLALLSGSPAIDQIPLDTCQINGITTDQRGVKRPDGHENACDIGAFEYMDRPT